MFCQSFAMLSVFCNVDSLLQQKWLKFVKTYEINPWSWFWKWISWCKKFHALKIPWFKKFYDVKKFHDLRNSMNYKSNIMIYKIYSMVYNANSMIHKITNICKIWNSMMSRTKKIIYKINFMIYNINSKS